MPVSTPPEAIGFPVNIIFLVVGLFCELLNCELSTTNLEISLGLVFIVKNCEKRDVQSEDLTNTSASKHQSDVRGSL